MNHAIKRTLFVWAVLMLSTAASTWGLSEATVNPVVSTVAVTLIAAIKVGLVMAFFMDLWIAPRALQGVGVIWIVATAGMVLGIYLRS